MAVSRYGAIVGADDVIETFESHLKQWAPAYLAEVARQAGLAPNALGRFHWEVDSNFVALTERQSPACVVLPGPVDDTRRHGDGKITGSFTVEVQVFVAGPNRRALVKAVARYIKAVRAAVLQHPTLGGFAIGVDLVGEDYDEQAGESSRFVGGGVVVFSVDVADITDTRAGLREPPEDPLADPGAVRVATTVDVDVTKEQ